MWQGNRHSIRVPIGEWSFMHHQITLNYHRYRSSNTETVVHLSNDTFALSDRSIHEKASCQQLQTNRQRQSLLLVCHNTCWVVKSIIAAMLPYFCSQTDVLYLLLGVLSLQPCKPWMPPCWTGRESWSADTCAERDRVTFTDLCYRSRETFCQDYTRI